MLSIRLQRTGRINDPSFRIIVTEHTSGAKSSSFIERLGSVNPKKGEWMIAEDRVKYWLSVGAQATPTVHNMLVTKKVISAKKIAIKMKKPEVKVEAPAA
jgi:small subunit ribosomal protein S16